MATAGLLDAPFFSRLTVALRVMNYKGSLTTNGNNFAANLKAKAMNEI